MKLFISKCHLYLSLVSLYMIVAVLYQQQILDATLLPGLYLFMILIGLLIIILNLLSGVMLNSFIFTLLILFLVSIISVARQYAFFGSIFSILVCYSASNLLLSKIASAKRISIILIPFYIFYVYILYRLYLNPDPNKVFINSRNWISFFGILLLTPYYILQYLRNKKLVILPSLLFMLLCFYSLGRIGILSSFFLFLAVINHEKKLKLIFYLLPLLIPLYGYYLLNYVEFVDIYRFYNFRDEREWLWTFYFENMDLTSFLFGMDIFDIYLSTGYTNLHSSYLNIIYYLGFLGYLFIFILLATCLIFFLSKKYFLLCVLLSIMLRVTTDVGALFGFFDISFWLCVLFMIRLFQINYKTTSNHAIT